MADQSGDNGSSIVAIFAIVIIAAMAIGFFIYALPRMQQKDEQPSDMNIKIDLPTNDAAQPQDGGGEPAPQPNY